MEGRELITSQTLAQYQLNEDHLAEIVRAVAGGSGNLSDIYPLSPLQEGLLFHGLLNEKQDTYILSVLFELASREQVPALAAALQRVVDRHEILRSAILWQQLPQALHVVHRRATLPVSEFALDADRDLSAQLRELTKPLRCALRLDRAPLLQLEVAPHPHGPGCFAVLRVHHVACDHQSLRTIVAETLTILEGRGTELPEPVSFREHTEHAQIHAQSAAAAEFFGAVRPLGRPRRRRLRPGSQCGSRRSSYAAAPRAGAEVQRQHCKIAACGMGTGCRAHERS
jgi:hypothetical protein